MTEPDDPPVPPADQGGSHPASAPDDLPPGGSEVDEPAEGGATRRFWSLRRVPAGVLALLIFAGAGLLLYEIAAVRAGREAMLWRKSLAHQLAVRHLDDPWVLLGASVTAVIGLWLLLLALTPGLRQLLVMRHAHPDVRAGLHRAAATLVLRDRAMEVSGVQTARVRTGRRKVKVRALAHFRELDDVRADLDVALSEAIGALGLARPLTLTVRVARPGRRR
jgi:hypothetical protein